MAKVPAPNERPVWRILYRTGHQFIEPPPPPKSEGKGFFSGPVIERFWEIIKTPPGSGKSRDATEFVNVAWEEMGKKGLYLMLSHEAIKQRLDQMKEDGKADLWTHWRGHDDSCPRRRLYNAGYSGSGDCDCQRGERKADGPTLAPLEYVLPGGPGLNRPLVKEAERFDFWIIDEMDFRRLLDVMCVNRVDVGVVAETHPEESVRILSTVLGNLMSQPPNPLSGHDLYGAVDVALNKNGTTLRELINNLGGAELPKSPWLDGSELPKNFPPVLVPVLIEESKEWLNGEQFNPRIHISQTDVGNRLRIWWRKDLDLFHEFDEPPVVPPFFLLDATADPELLRNVIDHTNTEELPTPEWPADVHIDQWADDMVSRQTLGVRRDLGNFSKRSIRDRKRWYARITEQLGEFPRNWPVGIITHKAIYEEARQAIEATGFTDVQSLYYGDDRGSNIMKDVRVLVLLGLTIPNGADFKEEAQAFLYDNGELDFKWETVEQHLEQLDGSQVMVKVGGFWNEPVASYYRQKCQFGLYQSINRIRPYEERDFDRHVFVFTNMPIPGVKVEHIMRTKKNHELDARWDATTADIRSRVRAASTCTVTELVKMLAKHGGKPGAHKAWVTRNSSGLAEASGTTFEKGDGSRPGRFVIHRD